VTSTLGAPTACVHVDSTQLQPGELAPLLNVVPVGTVSVTTTVLAPRVPMLPTVIV